MKNFSGKAALVVLALILLFGFSLPAVSAEEKKAAQASNLFPLDAGFGLLEPIKGTLSSSAWLIVEKISPSSIKDGKSLGQETGPVFQQAGLMGSIPYRSPAPAFSRNLLITRELGLPVQTEPHIAVNPNDPNHLIMSAIDYALPYNATYVSIDGGQTWQGPNRVPLTQGTSGAGDPAVGIDRQGKAFQVFMAMGEKPYNVGPFDVYIPIAHIAVSSSEDGGIVWQQPAVAAKSKLWGRIELDEESNLARGIIGFSFLDKPWMAVGPDASNLEKDVIYVTYTEFADWFDIQYAGELAFLRLVMSESTILMVSSKDGGRSWSEPKEISPKRTLFELGQGEPGEEINYWTVQGSYPQVGKDGAVYISWYDSMEDGFTKGSARVYLSRSKNGRDFAEPVAAAEFWEGPRKPQSAFFRNSYFPQMAIGPNGEVYIIYPSRTPEKPTDDGDIYFVRSLDNGRSFGKPVKLNQDETDRLQFFPALAIDPKGNLHAMWGDMRDDPAGLKYHIYYTQSLDRGENWGFEFKEKDIKEPDTRVTDFPSNPNKGFPQGRFIGDYFAIAASQDDVFMVWADTRLGEYGSFNQKIGFARRKAMPSPEVFVSPPRGPIGQTVTIQAFNFQPEMNLFVKIAGRSDFVGKTDQDGRLTFSHKIPLSAGDDTYEIAIYDESANWATASFYVEFGFGDLAGKEVTRDSLEKMQQSLDSLKTGAAKDRLFSWVGLVIAVGLLGLLLAIFFMARAKK